jgi:predicted acylesterase/phospholipase RssA
MRRRRRRPWKRQPPGAPDQPSVAPPDGAVRIALILPGGVTFGTVEGGAVCALLVAVQAMNKAKDRDVACIDIVAGSSAGALSGVLTAHTLLWGHDPVPLFRRAWVADPSLKGMLGRGRWAPLSLDRARAIANDLIADRIPADLTRRQKCDVTLTATLGLLRGASYDIVRSSAVGARDGIWGDSSRALHATSYLDWATNTLRPLAKGATLAENQKAAWRRAVDAALASASHPVGFPPWRLERDREEYASKEVKEPLAAGADKGVRDPEKIRLWYTDGGLVDNQPLGRGVELVTQNDHRPLAAAAARDPTRLVVLVRSGTDRPPDAEDPAWAGATKPRWFPTLLRALGLVAAHNVGEDLRHLEKVNTRVARTVALADVLAPLLRDDAASELRTFVESIDAKDRLELPRRKTGSYLDTAQDDPRDVLLAALLATSGLHRKRRVDVSIVEPDPGEWERARGFLRFGGFLDRRRREYDFAVGYRAMVEWMDADTGLRGSPLSDTLVNTGVESARQQVRSPSSSGMRRWTSRPLGARARLLIARLSLRVFTISLGDAIAVRRGRKTT